MAVILYRAGNAHTVNGIKCEVQICNEYSYLHYLDEGWFYTPEECYAEKEQDKDDQAVLEDAQEESSKTEEAEEESVLTDDEIRAMAKESGISHWHTKSIGRLVEELKELEDAE